MSPYQCLGGTTEDHEECISSHRFYGNFTMAPYETQITWITDESDVEHKQLIQNLQKRQGILKAFGLSDSVAALVCPLSSAESFR